MNDFSQSQRPAERHSLPWWLRMYGSLPRWMPGVIGLAAVALVHYRT